VVSVYEGIYANKTFKADLGKALQPPRVVPAANVQKPGSPAAGQPQPLKVWPDFGPSPRQLGETPKETLYPCAAVEKPRLASGPLHVSLEPWLSGARRGRYLQRIIVAWIKPRKVGWYIAYLETSTPCTLRIRECLQGAELPFLERMSPGRRASADAAAEARTRRLLRRLALMFC
jgi:hypothetical protein